MVKVVFTLILFVAFTSCKQVTEKKESLKIESDAIQQITSVKTYDYDGLKPLLEKKDDKTYIINFWATWCAPCVKELPHFEKIRKNFATKNVEVLLVSLDFSKQVEKQLIPFINRKKLQSKVVLLDDANEDFWIKAIDPSWSGALPATIIYNKNSRKFYEQSFTYEVLENELKTFLN